VENRIGIYYWKCDRPYAFHSLNTSLSEKNLIDLETQIKSLLTNHFGNCSFNFSQLGCQGNHIAYIVNYQGSLFLLRIENGPEGDNYMEVEARLLDEVRSLNVPTPHVYAVNISRSEYPFAYQILDYLPYSDLNKLYKKGELNILDIATKIGKYIALYQQLRPEGYGLFNSKKLLENGKLSGLYKSYREYFFLNWEKHHDFLVRKNFISIKESHRLKDIVNDFDWCLDIDNGCLVHKDMALWNVLGTKSSIEAFIDWDDAISGDITDDISLLACFHSGEFINLVIDGYKQVKDLPDHFIPSFWLHLLRNMIVKSVIRLGAGYFNLKDDFFLINSGKTGKTLQQFTKDRINIAYLGLKNEINISNL